MALIYRAHFALIRSPRFTRSGQCTSAVFGMANTLLDLTSREKPSHLAAAFDTSDPTARHVAYPEYKAHRDEMPEDLSSQLPLIDQLMDAFCVPALRLPGYEADDIIGTLAHQAEAEGFQTLMVTPDKDYDQLVTPSIQIWKPGRQGNSPELFGVPEVLKKWEVERIEQVIDILALMGDSSDNIPGVPGIGPKTAVKLIQQFGSIENLLANTGELKGKQRENLEKFVDQARMSKQLVTIQLEVPHEVQIQDFVWNGLDDEKLKSLFHELEFESLGKRLFGDGFTTRGRTSMASTHSSPAPHEGPAGVSSTVVAEVNAVPSKNALPSKRSHRSGVSALRSSGQQSWLFDETESFDHNDADKSPKGVREASTELAGNDAASNVSYRLIQSQAECAEWVERWSKATTICLDTETTGLDPRQARLLGVALAITPQEAFYVVIGNSTSKNPELNAHKASHPLPNNDQQLPSLEQLRPLLEDDKITKIGHNLKYDITVLRWHGVEVRGPIVDSMLAHVILAPEMDHGMDHLAQVYLDYETIKIEQLIGPKGPNQLNMADIPVERVVPYACEDADVTLQLAGKLMPEIEASGLRHVCYDVEFPLIPVLVDMEFAGIRLDKDALEKFSKQLEVEIVNLEQNIYETAGRRFNIDSPKQLGDVLYKDLQIESNPKKTATGQFSTRESELERLSGRHPIIADILDYRNATKLKRTYVDQLPQYIDSRTGRLHTVYSQAWTATGRMQSVNPNLQTIPIRKERGREIRAAFVPRDDNYLILSADYSQIELRVMAELSGDPAMLEAFQQDIDIHAVTASKVFGVPVGLVTREMRAKAKMVNFGIIYGISSFGLQQRLNIPRAEASELIENYFAEYPKVKEYTQATIEFARQSGYVQTMTGRRRYLRDINSRSRNAAAAAERLAMNSPIQGTAADILKLAMIRVHRELKQGGFQTKMLLTVHDEIVFDMHKSEVDSVLPVIREAMSKAFPMRVPLVVDTGFGENWLAAH